MTTPAIKVCGINTPAALDAALAARVEYIGLNFFARSPRVVTAAQAAALTAQSAGRTQVVGLFVDAPLATIAETARAAALDVVQLHGAETPETAAHIRRELGVAVWKALPVASAADVARAQQWLGAVDLILFDAKPPPAAAMPGGHGLVFDWSLLDTWRAPVAWGLAGGLNPANVAEAVARTRTPLVDVSSGVESSPGVKDAGLITRFAAAVRGT